jgi:hypothetical protein
VHFVEHRSSADAYLSEVLVHVRWKKAHGVIRQELSDHIEDAWLGFLAQGMNDGEAQEKAVLEMGDAADVGARFDKAYRPAKNYGVWVPFAVLFLIGVLFRYIAAGSEAFSLGTMLFPIVFAASCFLPFGWLSRFGYQAYGLYVLGFLILSLPNLEGTLRFLYYMPTAFPCVYALLIYHMRGKGLRGILLLGIFFGAQATIHYFALIHERISLCVLCLICLAQLLYAVLSGWFSCRRWVGVLIILAPTLLFITTNLLWEPYRAQRLVALFSADGVYLSSMIKHIFQNAPWFGEINTSALDKEVTFFLFGGQQNYFIGEHFLIWLAGRGGRFAFMAMVILYMVFFAFAFYACFRQRSMLYRLASFGITLHMFIEFISHVLANLAIMRPLYFLPFVSGNGETMLVNAALTGLLFSMLYNDALADKACKRIGIAACGHKQRIKKEGDPLLRSG